jgi:hypothetical protein
VEAKMSSRCDLPLAAVVLVMLAAILISCGNNNPDQNRVLLTVAVTPATADPELLGVSEVVFSANGTFSEIPSPALLTFAAPYTGAFSVGTFNNQVIATIVSTGSGTATLQCVSGMSGTVEVAAAASANNGTNNTVSGIAQLTCP